MNSSGLLFVLSGPSGVGKDAVLDKLLNKIPNLVKSISVTTRPMRVGERNGENYFFVDEKTFKEMVEKGEFLEWAQVHSYFYGTPKKFVEENIRQGRDVILKIDVQGGLNVKNLYKSAILIFLLPPSLDELRRRLVGRETEKSSDLEIRWKNVPLEISKIFYYDYLVVNDNIDEAVENVKAIILAERCRLTKEKAEYWLKKLGGCEQ
ncbi:MAG: guanylate kinase [Dictyoglomus sp. NZ13-RE01]|nr:MAG: guanylate kinase [Dictyoglomus sp. NZ13-RE01]